MRRNSIIKPFVFIALFSIVPVVAGLGPSPEGWQKVFDLSVERKKLALERDLIDKRLEEMDKQLAELEGVVFSQFERVATPTGSDYWESISDTVLFATASQDIVKGELLMYHAPGIYRVNDAKPKLATKGECWYFRPDRNIENGQQITIQIVYDAPEEIALLAKGFAPVTDRARDADRAYNAKITFGN